MTKKIVAIGPESTGKSTLCAALASHFRTAWCPEYAREYLLGNPRQYTYEDLLSIAKSQVHLEESIYKSLGPDAAYYFIDTDMYVMKVWSEFVFGKCHSYILEQIATRKYDLYLLCSIDLPWVADELREYPDGETRTQLFHIYKDLLVQQHTPFVIISGNASERLKLAIKSIAAL